MKTLIVVDMQNDFITGSLGTKEAQAILPNVKKKIEEYKACGDLETSEGKYLPVEHCIIGTFGHEILPELYLQGCSTINKRSFGYLFWGNEDLSETSEIELIGVCTDICVISNALILKATYPEINITVDASCCAGVTPEKHQAALEVMKSCQINVIGE